MRFKALKIQDIMTPDPVCCTPDTGLGSVAQLMCHNDCGEIPVVDNQMDKKPVGVITDRDITCRAVAEGKNPFELRAGDCMTTPCITVTPDMSIEECVEVMEIHKIRRVVVIDPTGRICGIVAQADIAKHGAERQTARVVKEVSEQHANS